MKFIIFWDITPCSPFSVNRRFGGTYLSQSHLFTRWFFCSAYSSILKIKATCSSETSVDIKRLHGFITQKIVLFIIFMVWFAGPVILTVMTMKITNRSPPTFRRNVSPTCSGSMSKPSKKGVRIRWQAEQTSGLMQARKERLENYCQRDHGL
jgi:hypothetical protein